MRTAETQDVYNELYHPAQLQLVSSHTNSKTERTICLNDLLLDKNKEQQQTPMINDNNQLHFSLT